MDEREETNVEREGEEAEAGMEAETEKEKAAGEATDVERLKEALDSAEKDAAGAHEKFLRKCADLENYKKRVEKEKAYLMAFANEKLMEGILPALDNLERALGHADDESGIEGLKEGVDLTLSQMHSTLEKFGLKEIKAVNERFDPTRHEA
ncbi:MAG: nucleotide exchange factor GrpE, partial [Thermodesulfobacteriota bacterium]